MLPFILVVYGDFLINGPNCKIPNMDPYERNAMKAFTRHTFKPCSDEPLLTSVKQNFENDSVQLIIHHEHKNEYLSWWQSEIKVRTSQFVY